VRASAVCSLSCADVLAAAVLGFALGLGVNGSVPQLRWLCWLMLGQ